MSEHETIRELRRENAELRTKTGKPPVRFTPRARRYEFGLGKGG